METRPPTDYQLFFAHNVLDERRHEAREDALGHEAKRRKAGRLPRTVGHALIFLGRVIAAEPC